MAMELVPSGDERCDVCAGNRDRPKPKPGERGSARETVSTMCEACFDDFRQELWVTEKFLDPIHREVKPPDDPSQN